MEEAVEKVKQRWSMWGRGGRACVSIERAKGRLGRRGDGGKG